jgi:predicted transcriptional regulator of viral defense system
MAVATPATTVLDLAARPSDGGGLDNVATVLIDLADHGRLDPDSLRAAAHRYSVSAVRRAGWILEHHTDLDVADSLDPRHAAPTMLDPHGGRRGPIDPTWQLIINTDLQPDT